MFIFQFFIHCANFSEIGQEKKNAKIRVGPLKGIILLDQFEVNIWHSSSSKSSQGNKVMLEKMIKHAWRINSYGILDTCKSLLNLSLWSVILFYIIQGLVFVIKMCHFILNLMSPIFFVSDYQ